MLQFVQGHIAMLALIFFNAMPPIGLSLLAFFYLLCLKTWIQFKGACDRKTNHTA